MRTTKLRLALVLLLSVWTNVLTASSTNVEQAEEDARETARRVRRKKTGPVVLVVDDAHFVLFCLFCVVGIIGLVGWCLC